jgi:hypothetical protein
MVEPDLFEEVLAKIKDERYRKIIKAISTKKKVLGKDVVIVQEMSDSGGFSNVFGEGDFDYEEYGLNQDDFDKEPTDEDEEGFYPSSSICEYEEALAKLLKKKENKDKGFILDNMGIG